MLGPFRIRNLRRSTSPPNRASYAAASRRGSLDILVSIKGQEYDDTVLMHPGSKLKYLDEDDGEMVTVGTSLELSQRLDEPVLRLLRSKSEKDITLGSGNSILTTSSPLSQPTHVFEIERRDDAIRIWKEIEERSSQLRASLASEQPELSAVATVRPPSTPRGSDTRQQSQSTDLKFRRLCSEHDSLSEALYPQQNGLRQMEDEVAQHNQPQQTQDEYSTSKSDELAAIEYHVENDDARIAEDRPADLTSRRCDSYHENYDCLDHQQSYQEVSITDQEVEDEEKEGDILKELEAISSHDGLNVSYVTIPGRLSLDGASAIICLDPNCAVSLVDSTFLQKHLPDYRMMGADPVSLPGVGETFWSSDKFAIFDLYIPCNGNKIAKMSRGARVVENLPVHVLIGTDIIVPEGITINFSERLATITSCENLQVPLSTIHTTQERPDDSMQKHELLRSLEYRESPRSWPALSGACRYCRRRKIRCYVAQTSSDGRCVNCVRFEQDCKFMSKHGPAWNSAPTDRGFSRRWSNQSYSPNLQYDPRLHYFTASNPPQLTHEKSEEADKPAHHTSMRVSDVLNDENEAKEVCEETAPLLESFSEGNLTAEGKRQAMEAGKRLRSRSHPALQMIWSGGFGSQKVNNNRWAQYGSTEAGDMAEDQSSSTPPTIELAQRASPHLMSPMAHPASVNETEGSLLHAFRTELAKISSNNVGSAENKVTQKEDDSPEKATVQEQPQSRAKTSGSELENLTRNLILQTIASIGSNVETLKAQLQSHVLDVIPEHIVRPRATPIKYHLRNACSDFKSSIDVAMEALAVEPSVEDNTFSSATLQLQPSLPTAIRSLQAMTYAFDTFSQRLRMIEDSKVSFDRDGAVSKPDTSTVSLGGKEDYQGHSADLPATESFTTDRAIYEGKSVQATAPSTFSPNETTRPSIQRKNLGPSMRTWNTQAVGDKGSNEISAAQNTIRHPNESPITYRHVASPSPCASSTTTRGRQPLQEYQMHTSALPPGLVNKHAPFELQYKRRSMPEKDHRRESGSRSRSPNVSMAREMPAPQRSEAPHAQVPRSEVHSSLPIRTHVLGSGPGRLNTERHSTLSRDAASSGYRPLAQQRLVNKAAHVRFGATSVCPPNSQPLEDKTRMIAATQLRHSKSLGAARKPPPPLNFTTRKELDTKSRLPGTLNNPFNNRKKAEFYNLPSPASTNASMSYAAPSSTLVATRFPTLEQFEDNNRGRVTQFPALPSMEPLIPVRVNVVRTGTETDTRKSRDSGLVGTHADQKLSPTQKDQAQQRKGINESSGDFFRRMTGLDEHSERLNETTNVSSAPLGARLIKPFDPHAETATIHRQQLIEGVRRSATVSGLSDRYAATNRRPYSAYFDGNGRVAWDSFLGHCSTRAPEKGNRNLDQSVDNMYRKENLQRQLRAQKSQGFPGAVGGRKPHTPESTLAREEASTPLHHDPSTVSSVQFCVDQLKDLGFGNEEDGGAQRLVVYAQAANGNLEVAMDMIDEERKAYKERS